MSGAKEYPKIGSALSFLGPKPMQPRTGSWSALNTGLGGITLGEKKNDETKDGGKESETKPNEGDTKTDESAEDEELDGLSELESIDSEADESVQHSPMKPEIKENTNDQPAEIGMQPFEVPVEAAPKKRLVKFKKDIESETKIAKERQNFIFGLCVVDFHHIRGPEIEYWLDDTTDKGNEADKVDKFSKIWPQLPFQALPDGAHLFNETFTSFTLTYDDLKGNCPAIPSEEDESFKLVKEDAKDVETIDEPFKGLTTLFGCACIRQLDTEKLKEKGEKLKQNEGQEEYTRSVIQKAVVLITRYPITIQLKEKLGIITKSYFEQLDFSDKSILKALYDNISLIYNNHGYSIRDDELYEGVEGAEDKDTDKNRKIIRESDFYSGLNLKDLVTLFKRDLLVIYKAILLEQRILIFCKDLPVLSNIQYSLISLIPNLIMNLSDCGSPILEKLSQKLKTPTSLRSSDRGSMLRFIGLPLQVFGKNSFFQPFLTLQQLDYVINPNTHSFLIGSSNDILLEHRKEWFDLVVYIGGKQTASNSAVDFIFKESSSVKLEFTSKDLKDKLSLTWQDRRFIDHVIDAVTKDNKKMAERSVHGSRVSSVSGGSPSESSKGEGEVTPSSPVEITESGRKNNQSKTLNSNLSMDSENYSGGDDFIRYQFEDYLIGMLSTIKYDNFLDASQNKAEMVKQLNLDEFDDAIGGFNQHFITRYKETTNYKLFDEFTEDELFNFFNPVHIGAELSKKRGPGSAEKLIQNFLKRWGEKPGQMPKKKENENRKNSDGINDGDSTMKDSTDTNTTNNNNLGTSVTNFFRRVTQKRSSVNDNKQ